MLMIASSTSSTASGDINDICANPYLSLAKPGKHMSHWQVCTRAVEGLLLDLVAVLHTLEQVMRRSAWAEKHLMFAAIIAAMIAALAEALIIQVPCCCCCVCCR
jgi:sugar phosphate permease